MISAACYKSQPTPPPTMRPSGLWDRKSRAGRTSAGLHQRFPLGFSAFLLTCMADLTTLVVNRRRRRREEGKRKEEEHERWRRRRRGRRRGGGRPLRISQHGTSLSRSVSERWIHMSSCPMCTYPFPSLACQILKRTHDPKEVMNHCPAEKKISS